MRTSVRSERVKRLGARKGKKKKVNKWKARGPLMEKGLKCPLNRAGQGVVMKVNKKRVW